MSLIALRPKNGREIHYFEQDGDKISLCGRAPMPLWWQEQVGITVTCKHCKRAMELVTRNAVPQPTPLFEDLPAEPSKKKTPFEEDSEEWTLVCFIDQATAQEEKDLRDAIKLKGTDGARYQVIRCGTHRREIYSEALHLIRLRGYDH